MGNTVSIEGPWAESFTETIVEEVAEREGVDPLELPPLYEAIDPEAVATVMTDVIGDETREGVCLKFSYSGYEFMVEDGEVQILEN